MKSFIILTLLVALTAAEWKLKTREEWFEIQDQCLDRFKISKELRERSKNEKYPPKEAFQTILCYFRDLEIWNDTEGFLVDRIMNSLEDDAGRISGYNEKLLREGLAVCSDKNTEGSLPFDWAYRCFKCFVDNKYLFDSLKKTNFYKDEEADARSRV